MKKSLFLFMCLGIAALCETVIPFIENTPVIDGRPDDACWGSLPWFDSFHELATEKVAPVQTRFKLFHDNRAFYIFIEAFEPDMSRLVAREYSHDSGNLWTNDTLEINFIHDPKMLSFHKLIVDSTGAWEDMRLQDDNTDTNTYKTEFIWSSAAELKVSRGDFSWCLEAALPIGAFGINDATSEAWRINVARNRYAGGKLELSSWASIPVRSHVMPKHFIPVVLDKFDKRLFSVAQDGLQHQFGKKNALFAFDASFDIYNNSKSFRLINAVLTLTCADKQYSIRKQVSLAAGEYSNVALRSEGVLPGKYAMSLELFSNNSKPVLLSRFDKALTLEYVPLNIKVLAPAYRNNIYATMPDKTILLDVQMNEYVGDALEISIVRDGKTLEVRKIPRSSQSNRMEFNGELLADGRYSVVAKVPSRNLETKIAIRKLPYQKGEIWLNASGVIHIDGKPFLPYGWYGTSSRKSVPWENNILLQTKFASVESARKAITSCRARNEYVICFPFHELDGVDWSPWKIFKDPDTRRKGLTDQQRAKITEFIEGVRDLDGVLAWYMADEPECRDNNPVWYEEALALISELDPYHPCIMLNWGTAGIAKYHTGGDILMPDCYPQYFEDGTTGKPLDCSSEWAKTAVSYRPSMLMPQMTCWPDYSRDGNVRGVAPDYFQQRMQFLQGLIHNVKGFNMYVYYNSQRFSSLIIGPDAIGKTLMILKELCLADTIPGALEVTAAKQNFQAGIKRAGDKICIIAVNTDKDSMEVTFKSKQALPLKLYVAGEGREIVVKGNSFRDSFAKHESHIYVSDKALADAVPSVPETVEAIRRLHVSRKKAGNLVATGELLSAQYIEYANGKIPENFPKIRATSDRKFYSTQKIGSLLYLLDGLTDPNRIEMTWSPAVADKAPAIDIELPKPSAVSRVLLYTQNGNLSDVRVTASNGDFAEVTGNTADVITLNLKGGICNSLHLEFLKAKKMSSGDVGERLLTEIEVY